MGVACSRPKAADTLEPTLPAPKGPVAPDAITLQMDAAMDAAEQRQRELDATARKRWTPALSSRSPHLEDQHAAATILQAAHRGHRSRKSNARSSKLAQAFDLPPFPALTPRPSQDAGVDVDARALVDGAIATALTHEAEPSVTPASRVPLHRSRVAGSQDWSIQRYSDRRSNSSRLDDRPTLTQLRAICTPPEPACSERIDETDPNENPRLRSAATLAAVLEERSVLVALRVRPLSAREVTSTGCIACDGDGVKVHGDERAFQFDCVLEDASQRDTYLRTGRPLLQKALAGFNGCLFAYGQTGSGKTHTMLGSIDEQGIIPLLLKELFETVESRTSRISTSVSISILEIYQEALHDLTIAGGAAESLIIREERGSRGIFVEGLSETPILSAEAALRLVEKAQARRAVGATGMNERSSRSHAVVTLTLVSTDTDDPDGLLSRSSKLHLIDLAGSERQKDTNSSGERLREGAQINLSLSALGNVINALSEKSAVAPISPRAKQPLGEKGNIINGADGAPSGRFLSPAPKTRRHIPYRDSKLTRLLQDSLGGNACTVVLCNASPAEVCREETISTLRFAERAKKIENKARVNVDPRAVRIADLTREVGELKATLAQRERYIKCLEEHY